MQTVTVKASKTYRVCVGEGLLSELGQYAAECMRGRRAVLVSDRNVWPLYGSMVKDSLQKAGIDAWEFLVDAGESSKNAQNYLALAGFLAERELTRDDFLVALGGGVVGDLTGFAAATYLRGIDFLSCPTSLLAMVDASVGGKTAIDLPAGKNLLGAFWQPSLVLCDTRTLDTLPREAFCDGCAEIIKTALLFDEPLYRTLFRCGLDFPREETITRCIEHKRAAVECDEFDRGARQLLNFGHSFGHAIEKASGYRVSHGKAVAIGMAMIARTAAPALADELAQLLKAFSLPTATDIPAERLSACIRADKKRLGDDITLVVPATVGCARRIRLPLSEVDAWIKAGM